MIRGLGSTRAMSKWWAVSIGVIILIGLYSFPREYPGLRFSEALYYTLRLFLLEHDLPRFPKYLPLVLIHFAAPVVSLSVAWTAASELFRLTPTLRLRSVRDHVVVHGVGRTGRIVAAALVDHGIPVVGVDLGPPSVLEGWSVLEKVPMVWGSFHSRSVLERARAVVFTAGDDLANLEGAVGACGWLPATRQRPATIWTHVADYKLAHTAERAIVDRGSLSIKLFDTYSIAAEKMIEREFNRELRSTVNEIFILGYGKFGRSLLDELLCDIGQDEQLHIKVVDVKDQSGAVRSVAAAHGCSEKVVFIQADINNLDLRGDVGKAYFLCTDNDLRNLTCALALSEQLGRDSICVRMTRWPIPAIADKLGEGCAIRFININQLVAESIDELLAVDIYDDRTQGEESAASLCG